MNSDLIKNKKLMFFLIFFIVGFAHSPHLICSSMENSDEIDIADVNMIYLTGFGPFQNYSVNPSELIVHVLNQTVIKDYLVIGRILPVDFILAPEVMKSDIAYYQPDLIISLGLDATCDSITIEVLSTNLQYDKSAEDSLKTLRRIQKNAPFFIPTRLNIQEMFHDLKTNHIPVSISFSAGLYVCNTVFYEILHYLTEQSLDTPMGFIHVPPVDDNNTSGMNIDTMIQGIQTITASNIN